jgi:hypothetical protein
LLALLRNLSVEKVTLLEPRTPHQPEKLKKVSKNEYGFTLSIFFVNEKSPLVTMFIFSGVQLVHSPMTGFGAAERIVFSQNPLWARLGRYVCIQGTVKNAGNFFYTTVNIARMPELARISVGTVDFDIL